MLTLSLSLSNYAQNLLCVSSDDDTTIKLCDFGFASRVTDEEPNCLTQLCGTPGYVAPEILKRTSYGKGVDLWSAGILTYILLGGYPPFYDEDQNKLYTKIKRGDFEFHEEHWSSISEEAKDLIAKMLVVDPVKRIDATAALDHPWVISDDHWLASRDLSTNLREFKRYNGKRKFKATAKALIAARRLSLALRPDPARKASGAAIGSTTTKVTELAKVKATSEFLEPGASSLGLRAPTKVEAPPAGS